MEILATSFSSSPTSTTNSIENMRAQAEELEAVFLNTLLSEMFSSVDTKSDFGGGFAEETWRGMQSEQYAAALAKTGGIGIADQILRSMLGYQEAAQASLNPANTNPAKATSAYQGTNS